MENQKKTFSLKKIINFLLFALFGLFAFLQLNDKDGLLWFSIYAIVALVHLYATFKPLNRILLWGLLILLLIYCLYHAPYLWEWLQVNHKSELFGEMVYEKPYLEGTREFLGLLIA
ncbi:MAG: transmembrane 220 family protein [Allomuricauda sp.]